MKQSTNAPGNLKDIDANLRHMVGHQVRATPQQLAQIAGHVATAAFTGELLEVDEPLWGGFWHFDVISPGYRLPAPELAFLRATRLDDHWPEGTSEAQFLADLRQAITHPQAGLWTLAVAGEPCAVFAASSGRPLASNRFSPDTRQPALVTVVWYCATTGCWHAGYRTFARSLHFEQAVVQRKLEITADPTAENKGSSWLAQVVEEKWVAEQNGLAGRLDLEILRLRLQMTELTK